MSFNQTFDTQKLYRLLLDGMSHPGEKISIESFKDKVDSSYDFPVYLFGATLLDPEVTYASSFTQTPLKALFYAQEVPFHEADYIFVKSKEINLEFLKTIKIGTMENPHMSATIFIEIQSSPNETTYELKGPGIKDVTYLKVNDSHEILNIFMNHPIEYPLGYDVIFFTESYFFALPRTTKLLKV